MSRSRTQHSDSANEYTQTSNHSISRLTLYQVSESLLCALYLLTSMLWKAKDAAPKVRGYAT